MAYVSGKSPVVTAFPAQKVVRVQEAAAVLASAPSGARQKTSSVVPARRWLALLSNRWLPRLMWSTQRTGRLGQSGLTLLGAGLIFLISTYLPLTQELESLRTQLDAARNEAAAVPRPTADPSATLLRRLPPRAQMPALLGVLLRQADAAHLSIDTGKYETKVQKSGGVMSYQMSFPLTGPYPQIRQFIDATLVALPAVAVNELSLTRKSIADGSVEAQIRLTAFVQDTP